MKKLLICLALTGCAAVGPDYHQPAAVAPATLSDWHGGSAELMDPSLRSSSGSQAYARFDDPVLKGLQERAMAANHDIRSAALHFAQSRAQRSVAGSEQGPQVGARAGATRQRTSENGTATRLINVIAPGNRDMLVDTLSDPFSVYSAGFDASWELDLWGRVRRSVEAADANMADASSVLRDVQLAVAVEVARNYFELRAAQRQLALLRADVDAASELHDLVGMRYKGGLASELDVERQQGMLAELRSRLPGALEQEAQAINRLTLLVGATPGALQGELGSERAAAGAAQAAPDAPFGYTPDMALGITSDIVARRPDIQSAEAHLHAATARIGVAKADLYPRITLGLSFGLESLTGSKFGDWGSKQWSVGPSLSLPLFDNGRRRASVELRELEQQEAAVNYQKTVLRAWHEVDNALTSYTAERQRQQQLKAREDSSRNALQLATTRFSQGLSDALPVLDAQRNLIAAQRDRIQGEAALTQKMLAICKAAGLTPQS
jgi:NodT family efflux transporter outer membrane factor (OMF) lipoprotein